MSTRSQDVGFVDAICRQSQLEPATRETQQSGTLNLDKGVDPSKSQEAGYLPALQYKVESQVEVSRFVSAKSSHQDEHDDMEDHHVKTK